MNNQMIEAASNAVVSTVGFYTGALSTLSAQIQEVVTRATTMEQKVAELAAANMSLQVEEAAARRVVDVARQYVEAMAVLTQPGGDETLASTWLVQLLEAVKVYDVRPTATSPKG